MKTLWKFLKWITQAGSGDVTPAGGAGASPMTPLSGDPSIFHDAEGRN